MNQQNDFSSEERDNEALLKQLRSLYQTTYRTTPADKQSLASIRARLLRHAQAHPSPEGVTNQKARAGRKEIPMHIPAFSGTETGTWKRRLNLLAAVIIATLLVGSLLFLFHTIHRSNIAAPPPPTTTSGHQPTPQTFYPIDAKTAWVATSVEMPYGGDIAGPLLRTGDGGKTWQDVTPPQESFELPGLLHPVGSTTAWMLQTAMASGTYASLLHTLDAGKTWQTVTIMPMFVYMLTFVDQNHGWVIGSQDSTQNPSSLYMTSDGGKTWQLAISNPSDPLYSFSQNTNIQFINAQDGWLRTLDVATNQATTTSEGTHTGQAFAPHATGNKLYATHDGGHSWQQIMLTKTMWPPTTSTSHVTDFAVKFFSARDGYLTFYVDDQTKKTQTRMFYQTHDAGRTWQTAGQLMVSSTTSTIDFINDHQIVVSAEQAITAYTLSNGRWVQTAEAKSAYGSLSYAKFVSSTDGLALNYTPEKSGGSSDNAPHLLKTTDGGKSWTPLTLTFPTKKVTATTMAYLTNPGWTYFTAHEGGGASTFSPKDQSNLTPAHLLNLSAKRWLLRFMCNADTAKLTFNGQRITASGCNQRPFSTVVTFPTSQPVRTFQVNNEGNGVWLVAFQACTDEKICQPDTL